MPSKEPVEFSIYLSPNPQSPQPIKPIEAETKVGGSDRLRAYLDLQTGKFTNAPSGDLEFEAFFEMEGKYERKRLRVTGLNGAGVLQVPPRISLVGTISPYEHVYLVAPETGYAPTTIIQRPGDSPEPNITFALVMDDYTHV